ncbi:hypothetical protein [Rubrivivax gelatinosus]|uniref:hypothetical protein n=1 Tax=Rubrivivax gelatinosus TaxID=28068 RepID=UPI00067FCF95|nr:hypothetical protein [Rubrivivax gelatinosus]MBG6082989.1 hypothetical protein [Rubrivivax gelatinosus]
MPSFPALAARLAAVVATAAATSLARAEEPIDVFARAIGAGHASGELTGAMAQRWKAATRSDSPVLVEAQVVKRFQEPGCARLDVVMRQDHVPLRGGGTAPYRTGLQLNVCTDGSAPEEGKDAGAFTRAVKELADMQEAGSK